MADAFRVGFSLEDIFDLTKIDPWFLAEIEDLIAEEASYADRQCADMTEQHWRQAKRKGFPTGVLLIFYAVRNRCSIGASGGGR